MLVVGFPAQAFATNCYVLAPALGEECLVVDPGIGVEPQLAEVLRDYRLRPAAVLLTHGHLDHVYAVTPVCQGGAGTAYLPAFLHPDDRYRLVDPIALLDPALVGMLEQQFGRRASWTEPSDIRPVRDGDELTLAGLTLRVDHAPGHTEGSVMYGLPDDPRLGGPGCVSGDVLFAGSVGRTDLPGGDPEAMLRSLAGKVLPLPDETVVLPGHGPATTIGRERATNPYLRGLAA